MKERAERKRLMTLQILKESSEPISSQKIRELLAERGLEISERTVRFHLQALDNLGFTAYKEKKGRYITPKGLLELSRSHVYEKVGFLSSRIDDMTYRMSYNYHTGEGKVLVNVSLVSKAELIKAVKMFLPYMKSAFSTGEMIALFQEGENLGETVIPRGYVGIGTVCSITLNGIMLSSGVPVVSLFGGLLEVVNGKAERFTAIIKYEGTSLDPLEIYIKSGMTNCTGIIEEGSGQVGASFREIPASSREYVVSINEELKKIGMGGIIEIGYPGQSLLGIPVAHERCGVVVAGGLNSVSVAHEGGVELISKALSGLVEFDRLIHYSELMDRAEELVHN
ncbi:MAG: NrpR regulatory domain-containing protein [Spirochaetales bacterium]|nr:NrpR regulatory domain-containing protein [Spirochaetales bacterium]